MIVILQLNNHINLSTTDSKISKTSMIRAPTKQRLRLPHSLVTEYGEKKQPILFSPERSTPFGGSSLFLDTLPCDASENITRDELRLKNTPEKSLTKAD